MIRNLGYHTLIYACHSTFIVPSHYWEGIIKIVTYSDTIEEWQGWLYIWPNIKWGLGTLFLFAFFLLFYKVVPASKVQLREACRVRSFSAIGWQLFSICLEAMFQMSIIQGYMANYLVSFFLYSGFI